jgi:hypothetical protein
MFKVLCFENKNLKLFSVRPYLKTCLARYWLKSVFQCLVEVVPTQ